MSLESARAHYKNNREAVLAKKRAHYQANREALLAQSKECHRKNRDFRRSLLSQFPCHCCGLDDPTVIDWHHVHEEDKLFNVAQLNKAHDVWWDEVMKCIPVCCNCHRKIHKGVLCLIEQPTVAG